MRVHILWVCILCIAMYIVNWIAHNAICLAKLMKLGCLHKLMEARWRMEGWPKVVECLITHAQ